MRKIGNFYQRLRFQTKVMILTNLLILGIFIALSVYVHAVISHNIEEEVGKKALAVSNTIAEMPEIINAFDEKHPEYTIQPFTKSIRETIDAEFIVVGNQDEIRYSHTLEERIGKKMVGDDNGRALIEGESYISKQVGSIGLSVRGKSPIWKDGTIIGVVSVGYSIEDINELVWQKNKPIILLFLLFLFIGIAGSMLIAKHLKKLLHEMEPHEIAEIYMQKEAVLQSTKEGIIAVDVDNTITLFNTSAKQILHMDQVPNDKIIGQPMERFVDFALFTYATNQRSVDDQEYILANEMVFMNTLPLERKGVVYGAIATFRKKTDMEQITKELSSIKQYTEGLRSQTHEFSNKMHTILGLLQLQYEQEAIDFIREEMNMETTNNPVMMNDIKEPAVQGLLIAKYNQANEQGIHFEILEGSQLEVVLSATYRDVILKVLGNIIDNAFMAVKETQHPTVFLFMTDIGADIVIEMDDNGPGIQQGKADQLFKDGYTTKQNHGHGKGLFLVKKAIHVLKGDIFLETSELKGARFVVIIPKEAK